MALLTFLLPGLIGEGVAGDLGLSAVSQLFIGTGVTGVLFPIVFGGLGGLLA